MTNNWKNIHRDFTKQLANEWIMQGFNYNQTADWINIGMTPQDAYYCGWLRDVKDKDCLWVLNFSDDELLRTEYKTWQIDILNNLNTPNNNKPFLTSTKLLILVGTIITIYLLTKNYD